MSFYGVSGTGSTNTKILRFNSAKMSHAFGCDYVLTNTAALGTFVTAKKSGYCNFGYSYRNTGVGLYVGITLNSSQLTTSVDLLSNDNEIIKIKVFSADSSGRSARFRHIGCNISHDTSLSNPS